MSFIHGVSEISRDPNETVLINRQMSDKPETIALNAPDIDDLLHFGVG